jgi:hypothetical protein
MAANHEQRIIAIRHSPFAIRPSPSPMPMRTNNNTRPEACHRRSRAGTNKHGSLPLDASPLLHTTAQRQASAASSGRVQPCRNARVQECKSASVQECKGARVQGCKTYRIPRVLRLALLAAYAAHTAKESTWHRLSKALARIDNTASPEPQGARGTGHGHGVRPGCGTGGSNAAAGR